MARNPKVELRGHEGQVVHPITDGDCVIFPSGETLSHKLSEQEEAMYAPEVTNSSPMFKVGEGDSSDYSANVLDGAYQEAVLKGQTYVNTIQEPSADVITLPTPFTEYERTQSKTFTEMQDGTFGLNLVGQSYVNCIQEPSEPSYVALGENLEFQNKKVEYTNEGQIKSAMLNGMTLVNLASTATLERKDGGSGTFVNGKLRVNFANYIWSGVSFLNNGMMKPSTEYTLIAKATNTTSFSIEIGHNNSHFNAFTPINLSRLVLGAGESGSIKIALTTRDDLQSNSVFYNIMASENPASYSGDKFIDVEIMIIEGDHTQEDIPYFQGMQSVTMSTELENVCSRYNSSGAKNGKTFTVGTWENRGLTLSTTDNIAKYNFKPNTKYLVQFKVTNLNLDGLSSMKIAFSDGEVSTGNSLFGDNALVEVKSNGIYRGILTTSNVISTSNFIIKGLKNQWEETTSTSRSLTISQIMCIEYQNGMENWDLPYFETTQLMKPLKVQSVNKNIVNLGTFTSQTKNGITLSSLDSSSIKLDGSNTTNDYTNFWLNSLYMKFKTGTYSYNFNYASDYVTYFFKDSNGNNIISTKRQNGTITINNDVEITQVLIQISNGFSIQNQTITLQIEESDVATTYTPHQSKTTSALEPITLRAIGNVKDTLDLSTGEYVQRIGEIVLDGDEDWMGSTATDSDGFATYQICMDTEIYWVSGINQDSILKSDKLPTTSFTNGSKVGIFFDGWGLYARLQTPSTRADFIAYLKSNPIKVQYVLANPITRKISLEYPNLQTYTDITHVQSIAMDGTLIPKIFLPSDISYKAMLKPNTSYNVIVDREVIDSINQLTVNLGGTTANITANRTVVRTPSTLSNETLTFSGKDNRIAKAMLIEGSTLINGDLPHFDGIGDVKLGRVVENLCMANHTTVGGAASTDTLYSDKITSKITKTGSKVFIFPLTKHLENGKKYFIYCPYDYQQNRYAFRHLYDNSLSYIYQSCEGVDKKYAIIQIDGNQQKNPYTHFTVGCHWDIPVNTTMTIRRPIVCEYIDGMENWDWESIGYFTGTRNIGNEFMRIGNKNLFDMNWFKDKGYTPNGDSVNVTGFYDSGFVSRKIKLDSTKQYSFTMTVTNGEGHSMGFLIKYTDGTSTQLLGTGTKTIKNDTTKTILSVGFTFTDFKEMTLSNIQIEEASSATSYVKHKHNSLHILPNEQIPLTFVQGATVFSNTTSFTEQINNTMTTRIRTGLLDLEPNETYRISCGDKNYIQATAFYNNSNIGAYTLGRDSKDCVFTTTKDVHKICINIAKSDMDANITPSVLHQVRLEKVTDVTLRGIGDVHDELDITRGIYIQRIGEKTFNGSETFRLYATYTNENRTSFIIDRGDAKTNTDYLITNKYKPTTNIQDYRHNKYLYIGQNNINIITEPNLTLEQFTSQLKAKPLVIQYELETPIEHKINIPMKNESNQTIAKPNEIFTLPLMYSETNHVDINSQIYPKVQSRDYISYPVIANNSQLHTVFHNKVGTGNLTVNLCGTSVTSVDGTSKCTITTPSTISQYELRLSGARNKVSNVSVFSGDYMNVNVPYVEGMMNAVNPIVKNIGKNLLPNDGYYLKDVYSYNKDGVEFHNSANRAWCAFFYKNISIPMRKGTYIFYIKLISGTHNGGREARLLFSDGTSRDGLWSYNDGTINMHTITLTSDKILIGVEMWNVQGNGIFQLYLGETPTPSQYEPYKENICEPDYGQIKLTKDMFEQGSFNELSSEKDYYKTKTASTHALQLKRIRLIDPIPVKPNTKYIVKFNGLEDYYIFVAYFKNNERVGFEGYWKNKEFITPNDCDQIVFVLKRKGDAQILVSDIDYSKLIFSKVDETIHLRSLPNGVRDELNLQTGEYIQRIGEVVLDGSEDETWYYLQSGQNGLGYFRVVMQDMFIENDQGKIPTYFINDKYNIVHYDRLFLDKDVPNSILISSTFSPSALVQCIFIYHNSIGDMTSFKTWLKQNPIIIQYQLATPIVKQIDINNFPHSYKDGHVIIENNDPSTNVTAQMTYQCVANRTGQIQEHTEQVEKQEHEINELEMLILENIRQQQNR